MSEADLKKETSSSIFRTNIYLTLELLISKYYNTCMKPQTTRVSLTINVWSYFYFWHTCFPANGQVLQNSTIYEIQDWIILDGLEGGATYSLELFTLYGSDKDNPIRSVPSNFTFVASELLKCYFCFNK